MIQIAVLNESTKIGDAEVQAMLPAFQQQWNRDLAPVWPVEPAELKFAAKGEALLAAAWQLVFLDNSDQAGALAYHDLTAAGLPISKVFVETILSDPGELVSIAASHELCEMAVDPWLNEAYQAPNGLFWAGEVCDPVEDKLYGYEIDGIKVTDFVLPGWFGHQSSGKGPYDFQKHSTTQWQVLSGGYAQYFDPAQGWVQVTGQAKLGAARVIAPVGSRRERRMRGRENWVRGAR